MSFIYVHIIAEDVTSVGFGITHVEEWQPARFYPWTQYNRNVSFQQNPADIILSAPAMIDSIRSSSTSGCYCTFEPIWASLKHLSCGEIGTIYKKLVLPSNLSTILRKLVDPPSNTSIGPLKWVYSHCFKIPTKNQTTYKFQYPSMFERIVQIVPGSQGHIIGTKGSKLREIKNSSGVLSIGVSRVGDYVTLKCRSERVPSCEGYHWQHL